MNARWLVLMAVLCWPGDSRGFRCPRPKTLTLLYPRPGETIPADATIYAKLLDPSPRSRRYLELISQPGDTPVPASVLTGRRSYLVRIKPAQPLAVGHRYAIRYRGKVAGSFTVSRADVSGLPPPLASSEVFFTKPVPKEQVLPGGVSRGRRAGLKLSGGTLPVVVEVAIGFYKRQTGVWVPYRVEPYLVITGSCIGGAPSSVPIRGHYQLQLKLWSAAGQVGPAIKHAGVIR